MRTTARRAGDVFGGSQVASKEGHRRFEFRKEMEGQRGILRTEEKFKRQEESAKSWQGLHCPELCGVHGPW